MKAICVGIFLTLGFPNGLGNIDRKHIKLKCLSNNNGTSFSVTKIVFRRSPNGSRPVVQVHGS